MRAHQEEAFIRVILAFTALALGGFAAPASAADWRLVSASSSGAVFVDAGSIRRDGKTVTFRLWAIYRQRAATGTDNAKALRRANCDDYSFTDLERTFFSADRVLEKSGAQPGDRASSGSLNHYTIRYACTGPGSRPDPAFADPYKAARAEEFWKD